MALKTKMEAGTQVWTGMPTPALVHALTGESLPFLMTGGQAQEEGKGNFTVFREIHILFKEIYKYSCSAD